MDNLFKKMTATCDELAKLMAGRGIKTPTAAIEARSGYRTVRVMLSFAEATSSYPDKYKFIEGDTLEKAVEEAEAWVMAQPTADERALQDCLELTAKALEASRKAGLDTGEGAAFVAQLEAMMNRLSENAITDQSEEVA